MIAIDRRTTESNQELVASSGVAFFTERRIASMSNRLGHTRLQSLMQVLSDNIGSRMNNKSSLPVRKDPSSLPQVSNDTARRCIRGLLSIRIDVDPVK